MARRLESRGRRSNADDASEPNMDDRNRSTTSTRTAPDSRSANASPWLTVEEAAQRARCGVKTIYREVHAKRLRAARVGGRRELRLLPEWIDEWLLETITPRPV
ncbi:MAG TPA: helix-turn-helix domain-containing protein [Vicinamibacterales bacterium]|nr:helix-turn-helix domain-containing protein [Vicinamibacterales bacterium]